MSAQDQLVNNCIESQSDFCYTITIIPYRLTIMNNSYEKCIITFIDIKMLYICMYICFIIGLDCATSLRVIYLDNCLMLIT